MHRLATVLSLFGVLSGHCLAAKEIPVEEFFATQDVADVTVSPDGRYIAARGDTAVQVLDFATLAPVGRVYRDASYTVVDDYWWVSEDRIVLTTRLNVQRSDRAWPTSTFIASNVDGKRQSSPYQLFRDGETRIGITIVDTLRHDERNVLVERGQQPFPPHPGRVNPQLMLLDVYSRGDKARLRRRQSGPIAFGNLYADTSGQARIAIGFLEGGAPAMFYRAPGEKDWIDINDTVGTDPSVIVRPVGFTQDERRFYVLSNHATNTMALYLFEPEPPRFELVREHVEFDISGVDWDPSGTKIVGLTLKGVSPKYLVQDKEDAKVDALRRYGRAFPGEWMQIASTSEDGNYMVLNVFSDRNPGVWYLLDVRAKSVRALMPQLPGIRAADMAGTTSLTIKARDGLSLQAYLTRNKKEEAMPLIVLPHAGPHGVRDNWAFDPVVQLFANRGFAVLRVNYRGSTGFGRDFERAGYREWGGTIIDDIIDATRAVAARDEIDGGRVCILGTHYGAFAALAAVARESELFRCAAGHSGIYDLSLLWGGDGVPMHMGDERSLDLWIGRNSNRHRAQSPVHHAASIEVPVLLSHGGLDNRAPMIHTTAMRDAIKAAGGTVKTLIEEGKQVSTGDAPDFIRGLLANADAFHSEEDKVRLYEEILQFVIEHTEIRQPG